MEGPSLQPNLDRARELQSNGNSVQAGEYHTLIAHEWLGKSLPTKFGTKISGGEVALLRAAICYRLGGRLDRCENRCRMGILVAEDMIDRVFEMEPPENAYDRARRGAWYEYIGDFRCIGDFGDPGSAYDRAIEVYEDAGDPGTECSEQEHMYTMAVYNEVARALGRDPEPVETTQNDMTLTDWVEKKRETYPEMLTELDERGEW